MENLPFGTLINDLWVHQKCCKQDRVLSKMIYVMSYSNNTEVCVWRKQQDYWESFSTALLICHHEKKTGIPWKGVCLTLRSDIHDIMHPNSLVEIQFQIGVNHYFYPSCVFRWGVYEGEDTKGRSIFTLLRCTHQFLLRLLDPSPERTLTGWNAGVWRPRGPASGTPWRGRPGYGWCHRSWERTQCPRSPPRSHNLLPHCKYSSDSPVYSVVDTFTIHQVAVSS